MRGIGTTISRRVWLALGLAGAAILAGSGSSRALAQTDEVALAVPRVALHDRAAADLDGLVLPHPLAAPDAVALRHLFELAHRCAPIAAGLQTFLQSDGAATQNDRASGLAGHVLATEALTCPQKIQAAQLRDWLRRWHDLPEAPAMARLLRQRDPHGEVAGGTMRLAVVTQDSGPGDGGVTGSPDGSAARLAAQIRARIGAGDPDHALGLLRGVAGMRPADRAMAEAEIAQALFAHDRDAAALALATRAARTDPTVGFASYVAGLAAWRLGRSAEALRAFAVAASASGSGPRVRSAAAYWAARASLATGDRAHWRGWLGAAAAGPDTLYSMVARRMLGWSAGQDQPHEVLGEADLEAVALVAGGARAFALLQIGQQALAAAELRQLAAHEPELARAVVLIAGRAGMFELAAELADRLGGPDATRFDDVRYPVPPLRPADGFRMDPALVYAIAQVESQFDAGAVSAEGAVGLMQVMPRTASRMGQNGGRLRDPGANLAVGQLYLARLAAAPMVHGDLIRLLAAYNDGPGKCARWCANVRDFRDPLLFIEAIPVPETRQFVERTLTGTWIYANRLGLPAPSLDAVVEGRFPRFSAGSTRTD